MGHLGEWTFNTNGQYKKMSDLTGLTFEDEKTYLFQIQNTAIINSSATVPTEGGFLIDNTNINSYTKQAGEDLYIKSRLSDCTVNISD